jgi:hypothetical protein
MDDDPERRLLGEGCWFPSMGEHERPDEPGTLVRADALSKAPPKLSEGSISALGYEAPFVRVAVGAGPFGHRSWALLSALEGKRLSGGPAARLRRLPSARHDETLASVSRFEWSSSWPLVGEERNSGLMASRSGAGAGKGVQQLALAPNIGTQPFGVVPGCDQQGGPCSRCRNRGPTAGRLRRTAELAEQDVD